MRNIFLFFVSLSILSCGTRSEYPGFSKSHKGFHYELLTIGEDTKLVELGDYVTADISYSTLDDSIFFEGRRKLKIEAPLYEGAIEDCFMMLRNNESAMFILSASSFFKKTLGTDLPVFMQPNDKIKIKITIIEIQTPMDFEKEKQAFINWVQDFGEYEKVLLNQYLNEEKLDATPTPSGLFYIPLVKKETPRIMVGDTITINYEGKFLNGKFFDSTKLRKQPLQFIFGTEWQVIKGLEEGLALMGEGEKALLIVPSEIAFGTKGNTTGIIPPFTSLIFEVEILGVNKTINADNIL